MMKNAAINLMKLGTVSLCFSLNATAGEPDASKCYSYLTELVRSSNFPFKYVKKDKVNLIIDDDSGDVVNGQLVFDTDGSGEIGWVEYHVKEQKLINTSVELEQPEELIFNKKYAEKYEACLSGSQE